MTYFLWESNKRAFTSRLLRPHLQVSNYGLSQGQRIFEDPLLVPPSSMAMDQVNRRLFLPGCSKVMALVDADCGKVITTLPTGDHVDATVFDPETKLIFNANGEATITIIRRDGPDQYSAVETVRTLPGQRPWPLIRRPTDSSLHG